MPEAGNEVKKKKTDLQCRKICVRGKGQRFVQKEVSVPCMSCVRQGRREKNQRDRTNSPARGKNDMDVHAVKRKQTQERNSTGTVRSRSDDVQKPCVLRYGFRFMMYRARAGSHWAVAPHWLLPNYLAASGDTPVDEGVHGMATARRKTRLPAVSDPARA